MSQSRDIGVLQQQVRAVRSQAAAQSTHSSGGGGGGGGGGSGNAALKIALIGPMQAGKTKITAHIVGLNFPNKYEATAGVRILELEEQLAVRQHEGAEEEELNCVVELWDCSGDQSYEACWAAICQNLDGIIVAFDPTNKSQANDVRIWCEWFCKRAHLVDGQVVIFAHGELSGNHKPLSIRAGDRTVLSPIVNVSTLQVPQPDEDGMVAPGPAKIEFRNFCSKVWETKAAQQ